MDGMANNKGGFLPPLKWAGGKRWLVPHLAPLWENHKHKRLVELFCGGLSVSLGLNPQNALLNDINPHLINFYEWLQQGLDANFSPSDNDKATFYRNRDRFNELIANGQANSQESAGLFYYLNRTCFNGLCRFSKKGFYNVPFGSYKTINYMTTQEFAPYQETLKRWIFTCASFETVDLSPDDFVYADPPYDVEFTQYSKEDFTWEEQIILADKLSKHHGAVVLSNQATDRIIELYQDYGFTLQIVDAPRRINSTGDRTPAKEVIAYQNIEIKEKPIQLPIWEKMG